MPSPGSPSPAHSSARRENLHVSDIAAILGKDERGKTKLDVYREKVGLALDVDNPDIQRGRKFEDIAADVWMEKTGMTAIPKPEAIIHPRLPFLVGHIDREVELDRNPLEIKCPRVARFWRTRSEGLDNNQIFQGIGYSMILAVPFVYWGIFCADNMEVLPFTIERRPDMEPIIESELDRFWNENVLAGVPPEAVNEFDQEKLMIDKIGGDLQVVDTPEFVEAARLLREASLICDDGEQLFEEQKLRVLTMIGNSEPTYDKSHKLRFGSYKYGKFADAAGHLKFNYYESSGKPSFDAERFLQTRPLVLDRVVTFLQKELKKKLATEEIEKLIDASQVNLDEFRTRGKSFPVFKPTYPKGRKEK